MVTEIEKLGRKAVILPLDMNTNVHTLDAFVQALAIELKTV